MARRFLLVAALGLLLAADSADVKKDKEKLQGIWIPVTVVENGKEQQDAENHSLTFDKDTFTIKKGDELRIKGTYKLDPAKKPAAMDLMIEEGQERNKGKTALGIYAIEEGTLKWCIAEPGTDTRPTEFASTPGSKMIFVTLKKEKK